MILDEARLKNLMASLPVDIQDTIESLLENLEQFRLDEIEWDKQHGEMVQEKGKQDTLIEELRKKIPAVPITRPNEDEMRIITAKFDGTCKECGGMIPIGTKLRWSKAIGGKHLVGECR